MRSRQIYLLIAILGIASVGIGTAYADFIHNAYADDATSKSAPSYADECAHGHNGFNCKPAQYKVDIDTLEAKERQLRSDVTTLESKIIQLEERLSIVDNTLMQRISILEGNH